MSCGPRLLGNFRVVGLEDAQGIRDARSDAGRDAEHLELLRLGRRNAGEDDLEDRLAAGLARVVGEEQPELLGQRGAGVRDDAGEKAGVADGQHEGGGLADVAVDAGGLVVARRLGNRADKRERLELEALGPEPGGADAVDEVVHAAPASGCDQHAHARALARSDLLADERMVERRVLERHGDRLRGVVADCGVTLLGVLDQRHLEHAHDPVLRAQAEVDLAAERAARGHLAQRFAQRLGVADPVLEDDVRLELDGLRGDHTLARGRDGSNMRRADVQADTAVCCTLGWNLDGHGRDHRLLKFGGPLAASGRPTGALSRARAAWTRRLVRPLGRAQDSSSRANLSMP